MVYKQVRIFFCYDKSSIFWVFLKNENNSTLNVIYFSFSGNENADRILRTLLGNANLTGALLACFMDNTLPGTFFTC